jgi:predicted transcriptional regulator
VSKYHVMKRLTIRLPDDLRAGLDEVSRKKSKPISDVVRNVLRRYVVVERFRALRAKALPFAEEQGLVTDDDVFSAAS